MASILEQSGAKPQKDPKFATLFIDRTFTGMATQRSVLHDPSDIATARFYGGRPDALWQGLNVELTNRNTLARRPGSIPFSTTTYPTPPDTGFAFELTNGTIQVIIDTTPTAVFPLSSVSASAGPFAITSVAAASGGTTVYTGIISGGAANAYVGYTFILSGFENAVNDGVYVVSASSNTTLTLSNANGVVEIVPAGNRAIATGAAVYTFSTPVPSGAANAFLGMVFQVAGFVNGTNNGPTTGLNSNGSTFIVVESSTTTITLSNSFAVAETNPATALSSGAVYVDNQNGTKTVLFGKAPGAGQTYFVAVAGVLYMGDGVDTQQYTPLNTNGLVWDWGIAAPTAAPTLVVTESGAAATSWQPNTFFSTMGIVIETNNSTGLPQAHQLISVNALLNNTTQFGTSGNGAPNWNQNIGGTTTDGTITWTNLTAIGSWQPNTVYSGISQSGGAAAGTVSMIYDPVSGGFYANSFNGQKTSGSSKPNFSGVVNGAHYPDGTCNWVCYANIAQSPGNVSYSVLPNAFTWQPSTVYGSGFGFTGTNNGIIEPNPMPLALGNPLPQITYYQHSAGGTSAATTYTPWTGKTFTAGLTVTADAELQWASLGSAVWEPDTPYSGWTAPNSPTFNCVVDTSGCLEVCTTTGVSGSVVPWNSWQATHAYTIPTRIVDTNGNNQQVTTPGNSGGTQPVWNATIGGTTADGGVTWTNFGPAYGTLTNDGTCVWTNCGLATNAVWAPGEAFNLPTGGFSPPSTSDPYGGSEVLDTNGDVEFTVNTGTSGATAPAWATIGKYTPNDGTVEWYNNGLPQLHSLAFTAGYTYAYSFEARSLDDYYSVDVAGTTTPPIPPGANPSIPLPPPSGSETEDISTASPIATITGGNAGAVITISGVGSTDPQVDTIIIWRSADGGGSDNMFELTTIPAPPPQANGAPSPWSFTDYLPDTPTALYPGLNELIPAPIDDSNNQPPSTFLPMVYNYQRIWGANGQTVGFSGGPDVITGNPNAAFNPSDELPFLAAVIRVVKNSQGLVVFLTDSIEFIGGGPSTASFFSVTIGPGIGLGSYNMLDIFAGEIFFFAADNELRILSPSLNITSSGFPIGDQFANLPTSGVSDTIWNSATGYLAVYQNGIDNCIIVADGATGWYRCNPKQVPGGIQGVEPVWSPYAKITNGCKMVQTLEVSPGQKRLLIGGTGPSEIITERNLSVFTDNGTAYDANFVMGAITLAHPGSLAVLKFLEFDFSGVSYQPIVSFLLNEISGTYTPFTKVPVFDPPSLYGTTIIPKSYSPNRYYFSGTAQLARCRFILIKVDFGITSVQNELFDMAIFGRILVET